jgi:hypothetical protein
MLGITMIRVNFYRPKLISGLFVSKLEDNIPPIINLNNIEIIEIEGNSNTFFIRKDDL